MVLILNFLIRDVLGCHMYFDRPTCSTNMEDMTESSGASVLPCRRDILVVVLSRSINSLLLSYQFNFCKCMVGTHEYPWAYLEESRLTRTSCYGRVVRPPLHFCVSRPRSRSKCILKFVCCHEGITPQVISFRQLDPF